MAEILATLDDVNAHLPSDIITLTNAEDDQLQIDAERIIKGFLAGTFTAATLAGWSDPDDTPEVIRSIAGRFIAAFFYKKRFAASSPDVPAYAQDKYDEAWEMLQSVKSGEIVLVEVLEEVDFGGHLAQDDFFPNDSADPPKFTMDMQF